jgi:hypothetical protein
MSSNELLENSMAGKVHDVPAPPALVVTLEVVDEEWRSPFSLDLNSAQGQFLLLNILKDNIPHGRRIEVRR